MGTPAPHFFLPFVMGFLSFYAFSGSYRMDFPGGSDGKASGYNVGDLGSIPGSGRSPGEGNDNPLQYSCLKNPTDRGPWQVAVRVVRVRHDLLTKPSPPYTYCK